VALPRVFYITTENTGANVHGIEQEHGRSLDVQVLCAQVPYAKRFRAWPPFYDQLIAKEGEWPNRSNGFRGVTHSLMSELAPDALTTMLTIDRHNWSGASVMSMMRLIWRYLEIWDSMLSELRPQCVIFHDSPHWGSAHVLYQCCLARGIPTVCVLNTLFRHRLIVRRTVVGANERHSEWRCRLEDLSPSTYVTSTIKKQTWSQAITATHRVNRRLRRLASPGGIRTAIRYRPRKFPDIVPDQSIGRIGRFAFNLKTTANIKGAVRFLAQHSQSHLPSEPYVYFPFHLQPEATTVPLGGCLWDQFNLVRLLVDCLPSGWKLVVKEHPQMFRYDRRWPRSRSLRFYEDLIQAPNVVLLGMGVSSLEASRNAEVVATVTGTVGWEALNLGKPVIAFGFPWYHSFPGVTLVQAIANPREYLRDYLHHPDLAGPTPESIERALSDACEAGEFMPGPWRDHTIDGGGAAEHLSSSYGSGLASYIRSIV